MVSVCMSVFPNNGNKTQRKMVFGLCCVFQLLVFNSLMIYICAYNYSRSHVLLCTQCKKLYKFYYNCQ